MRQFLEALWNSPQEVFLWFMAVMWHNFLYVMVVMLLVRWLWRLGGKPAKAKK